MRIQQQTVNKHIKFHFHCVSAMKRFFTTRRQTTGGGRSRTSVLEQTPLPQSSLWRSARVAMSAPPLGTYGSRGMVLPQLEWPMADISHPPFHSFCYSCTTGPCLATTVWGRCFASQTTVLPSSRPFRRHTEKQCVPSATMQGGCWMPGAALHPARSRVSGFRGASALCRRPSRPDSGSGGGHKSAMVVHCARRVPHPLRCST